MKTDKMRHWGPVGSYWAEKSSEIFSNHFDYFLFPDLFLRQIPTIRTQYLFSSLCTTCFVTNPAESERSLFQIQILDKAEKIKVKGTI